MIADNEYFYQKIGDFNGLISKSKVWSISFSANSLAALAATGIDEEDSGDFVDWRRGHAAPLRYGVRAHKFRFARQPCGNAEARLRRTGGKGFLKEFVVAERRFDK